MRPKHRGLALIALAAGVLGWAPPLLARASQATRVVRYQGRVIRVPRSWPVYDLRHHPNLCVRFDRPAVYVGTPGRDQRCPAHVAGRHQAILIEPGRRSPEVLHAPRLTQSASRSALARPAQAGGGIYTGLGFDACSAPSPAAMSAWGSSTYRGIGVYIGGQNMACSQTNLTSTWVSTQTAAGWHLIPTYVGLQAPSNSCGCSGILSSQAQSEGTAAASDAVARAEGLGIGPGNPIYFDMEAYPRGGTNTSAVLTFLAAWTAQLHTESYQSGVYSSSGSGISDLVAQAGTGYLEPDDLWIADWNGKQTTADSSVPSGDWATHQRLHQYQGAHNETHGGVTINIDGDYLDGATAGSGPPEGYWLFTNGGNVYGSVGIRQFGSPAAAHATKPRIVGMAATADGGGYWLVGASGRIWRYGDAARLGWTPRPQPVAGIVANPAGNGYWLFTAAGSVYPATGTASYGSPATSGAHKLAIVGMAATPDGAGYWLVGASGRVWAYGDAPDLPAIQHSGRIVGMAGL